MVSKGLLSVVKEFHVEEPTPDPGDNWADHTRISLELDISKVDRTPPATREHAPQPSFIESRPIDLLYQATMDASETPEKALESLWGPLSAESASNYVYVNGLGSKATAAGAGIFF
jgi:hypothetical protein